jgi:hypothetical protein
VFERSEFKLIPRACVKNREEIGAAISLVTFFFGKESNSAGRAFFLFLRYSVINNSSVCDSFVYQSSDGLTGKMDNMVEFMMEWQGWGCGFESRRPLHKDSYQL